MQVQQSFYAQGANESSNTSHSVNEENDVLGRDDFLKILITQLSHQDPLNPMDDRDFIAQMAQFSSLEQMLNIRESVDKLVEGSPADSHFAQYAELIGRMVSWNEDGDEDVVSQGIVQSVSLKDGEIYVEVAEREEKILLNDIDRIGEAGEEKDE